ncbi:MAG: HNH endonuclease signature motif containing protein [Ruminococcus sp.]
MAQSFAKAFYSSKAWQKCRASFITERKSIDGGLCEVCKEKHGYIVHHKIILTPKNINQPSITLSFSNLMYVCKECHDKFEGHGVGQPSRQLMFDENGMLIRF